MTRKINNSNSSDKDVKTISDDTILKISKEIAVKFIEVGRLTPSTFNETFKDIYRTIEDTVQKND